MKNASALLIFLTVWLFLGWNLPSQENGFQLSSFPIECSDFGESESGNEKEEQKEQSERDYIIGKPISPGLFPITVHTQIPIQHFGTNGFYLSVPTPPPDC